ncbi:Carnosine N-methyltransferase [Schizosaccharomyces pombe]
MSRLSFEHKDLLLQDSDNNFLKHLSRIDQCIEQNSVLAEAIANAAIPVFCSDFDQNELFHVNVDMMQKVSSTLKQIARDWSTECVEERRTTYAPFIEELNSLFPSDSIDRSKIRVLVPGSGLGRLAFDIAVEGFACQGNEFSYFMLLTSHFILNCVKQENQFLVYPYIHSFSNHVMRDDQVRSLNIPDAVPSQYLRNSQNFSMAAGDFLEVYGTEESRDSFQVVATCFFIDTTKNVLDYLDTIKNCLVDGGYWINLGPLLYHFESEGTSNSNSDSQQQPFVELTLEQLFYVMDSMGFEVLKHNSVDTTYMGDKRSMLEWIYHPHYWVCRLQKSKLRFQ